MGTFLKQIFLLLSINLLLGCAVGSLIDSPMNLSAQELRVGMSQEEVAAVLGAPNGVSPTAERGEKWQYQSLASSLKVAGRGEITANSSVTLDFDAEHKLRKVITSDSNTQATAAINSYKDCVAAGYPVQMSYPGQCGTPDGRHFIEIIAPSPTKVTKGLCVDQCGDGVCQEIVCQAAGCPCAENSESCAQDCPNNSGE